MQHPVGYRYNPDTGRAELTDFAAVMFNKVQLVTFPHVVARGLPDRRRVRRWASRSGSCVRSARDEDRAMYR